MTEWMRERTSQREIRIVNEETDRIVHSVLTLVIQSLRHFIESRCQSCHVLILGQGHLVEPVK